MNVENTDVFVVHKIKDKDERFKKLSLNDIYKHILPQHKSIRKQMLVDNLKLTGATKGEMLSELEAFDSKSLSFDDYIKLLNSTEGTLDIVKYAYQGENKELELTPADLFTIVRKLVDNTGIEFGDKEKKEEIKETKIENKELDKDIDPSTGQPWAYGKGK